MNTRSFFHRMWLYSSSLYFVKCEFILLLMLFVQWNIIGVEHNNMIGGLVDRRVSQYISYWYKGEHLSATTIMFVSVLS